MGEIVGLREAARRLDRAHSTIVRYLQTYPDLNLGSEKHPKVDVAALRQHRLENLNLARSGSYAGRLLGEGNGLDAVIGSARPIPNQADAPSYATARAAREVVLADWAQLDLDEKLEALVVRAEVEEAIEETARVLQRKLSECASQLTEHIATMSDPKAIAELLNTEHRRVLAALAASLRAPPA